ncbi:MAG: hypothetical protein AAFP89_05555 [Bacteroidota bacterium]
MKALLILGVGILMGLFTIRAQTQSVFDLHVPLADLDQIELSALGGKTIKMVSNNKIRLTPPDMSKLDQKRIISFSQDTFPATSGPDIVVTICEIDTFFVNQDVYLTHVPVEVETFTDRTFKGKSTFGWQVLRQIGATTGPILNQNGNPEIEIAIPMTPQIKDEDDIVQAIAEEEPSVSAPILPPPPPSSTYNPTQDPNLPFRAGDIEEIRLIKCNDQSETQGHLRDTESFLNQYIVFCARTSVDPAIPPVAAVNRIQNTLTIRYFQPFDAERATSLGEILGEQLNIAPSQILVEDMLPAYNGVPPRQDYLEIWFK